MKRIALLLAFSGLACADQTAIIIEVTSRDLVVPDDLDQVRFVANASSGVMADRTADLPGAWPQTFALKPGRAGSGEQINIQVVGLRGGTERLRRVLPPTRFDSGREIRITVELSRACLDVNCPMNADCIAGMCIGVVQDAGVEDGGFDAGMPDGGVDAPPIDAPVDAFDAGMDDGGVDAPPIDAPIDAPADVFDGGFDGGFDAGPGGLIISEYIEGSSNNKALELYNAGSTTVDLTECRIERYQNGSASASQVQMLPGMMGPTMLAPGAAYVLCHPSFSSPSSCDDLPTGPFVNHNGDDAYALFCGSMMIDSFGQIGVDPGTEWSAGGVSSANQTLRRRCTVVSGDSMGFDAFDPSIEWTNFPIDDFTNLGARGCP